MFARRLARPTVSRFLLRRMTTEASPQQVSPEILSKVLTESLAGVAKTLKENDGHVKIVHALILAVGAGITAVGTSLWSNVSLICCVLMNRRAMCEKLRPDCESI